MTLTVLFDAMVTLLCAALLIRHFLHSGRRLLLWAGLCFACLAVANALLFVDVVLVAETSFFTLRLGITAFGMSLLMFGLIWESQA